jgi:2-polyprenyl-3-methyl-5-hydroxy-6-metoxy-1,4-benzoquinol methylase
MPRDETNDMSAEGGRSSADSVACESAGHDPYRSFCRTDLLVFVPDDVRTVLSVGCARGATEAALVKQGVTVVGIELDSVAAAIARQRGVTVLEGDASGFVPELNRWRFDCLFYADILEHLPDPLAVLRRHADLLKPGGVVVVSVPNFRHFSVFVSLFVRGRVRYADAGILDKTHLRITTRKTVLDWFAHAGIETVLWRYNLSRRRDMLMSRCSLGLLNEFIAQQIIVVGKKTLPPVPRNGAP